MKSVINWVLCHLLDARHSLQLLLALVSVDAARCTDGMSRQDIAEYIDELRDYLNAIEAAIQPQVALSQPITS